MGRYREVQPGGVGDLRRALRDRRNADLKLRLAVFEAAAAGSSLRTIADVIEASHETVRKMISDERHRIAYVERLLAETTDPAARRRLERLLPAKKSDA